MATEKKASPNVESRLRHNILKMPQEVYQASGIVINGRRLKSFVFTTDLAIIKNDALAISSHVNIDAKNEYFAMIRNRWSEALGHAFAELPDADLVDKGDEFQAQ